MGAPRGATANPSEFRTALQRASERRVEERLELRRPRGVAQLAQRLRLDLADALAGDAVQAADFLERVLGAVGEPEALGEDFLLARRQRLHDAAHFVAARGRNDALERRGRRLVLDEVPQV